MKRNLLSMIWALPMALWLSGCPAPVEDCADGVDNDGDSLTDCDDASCAAVQACNPCGNGALDPGEECDGAELGGEDCASRGFDAGDLSCAADCSFDTSLCRDALCGDGLTEGAEACDDGNTTSGDGCRADCLKLEACGDAVLDAGEACDDGNLNDGDSCEADCSFPFCGNAIVDIGEACDDGNTQNGDSCSADCTLPFCGNGVVDPGEECDDANAQNGDSCNAFCVVEACGNGFLEPGEECDDANTQDGDACSDQCLLEFCGNGILDPGEECDDANITPGDSCNAFCVVEACGNGFLEPGEECDDANNINGDSCEADCSLSFCGNAILDIGEACDDGDFLDGDGCDDTCAIETGFTCAGEPSVCATTCGDGVAGGAEECDDGNNTNADGCQSGCTLICGSGSGADRAFEDRGSQHCYLGFDDALDWQSAQDDCASFGAHLVTIQTTEENDLARAAGPSDGTWIGMNDIAVENDFLWVNGEPVLFTNFAPGEPNNNGDEDCVHLQESFQTTWNDLACGTALAYVCELETPLCGNGFFETGEACDDANTTPGDGCDAACAVETGFSCSGSPSLCDGICGDGLILGAEECDDGNTTEEDGCEADCTFTCASGSGASRVVVDPATGNCYAGFDGDTRTYNDAQSFCQNLGGHLPSATSAAENTVVRSASLASDNPWLGADDRATEGTFSWLTQEAFSFANFATGEPDNDAGVDVLGDCLFYTSGTALWGDTNCDINTFVVGTLCEFEFAFAP